MFSVISWLGFLPLQFELSSKIGSQAGETCGQQCTGGAGDVGILFYVWGFKIYMTEAVYMAV